MLKIGAPPNLVIDFFAELDSPNAPPEITRNKSRATCQLFDNTNPENYFDFLECYSGLWADMEWTGRTWDFVHPLNEWTYFSARFSTAGDPISGFVILFIGGVLDTGRPILELSYQPMNQNQYVWFYRDLSQNTDLLYLDRLLRTVNESRQLDNRLPESSILYPEDRE